jgi:hypothetical protein
MDNHSGGPKATRPWPLDEAPMHLASDYTRHTPRGGRCRIRIYLPEEEQDVPVVICSELPNNGGTSITYAAEQLAAEVIRSHELPTPLVWVEHWPEQSTDGGEETFELVVFSSYRVEERAPYLGGTRARIGGASWKRLDRAMVEVLVGRKVSKSERGDYSRSPTALNPCSASAINRDNGIFRALEIRTRLRRLTFRSPLSTAPM